MFVDIEDHEEALIYPHLERAVSFISRALGTGGKCLVHCFAGSSRSGSCVIAYLMQSKELAYFDALRFVQSRRRVVRPNLGFGKQLIHYEEELVRKRQEAQHTEPMPDQEVAMDGE